MISLEQKQEIDFKGGNVSDLGRTIYFSGETMGSSVVKRTGLVKMTRGLMRQNGKRGETKLVDCVACTKSR